MTTTKQTPEEMEALRALMCLRLEVAPEIVSDILEKVLAAFGAIRTQDSSKWKPC